MWQTMMEFNLIHMSAMNSKLSLPNPHLKLRFTLPINSSNSTCSFCCMWICCGFVVNLWICRELVDLLWICCTTCCTTNPQQIEQAEFELTCSKVAHRVPTHLRIIGCRIPTSHVSDILEKFTGNECHQTDACILSNAIPWPIVPS